MDILALVAEADEAEVVEVPPAAAQVEKVRPVRRFSSRRTVLQYGRRHAGKANASAFQLQKTQDEQKEKDLVIQDLQCTSYPYPFERMVLV
jgi:hypothetical protein